MTATLSPAMVALIQQVLTIIGMVVTGFGWVSPTEWQGIMTAILGVIGPVMTLAGVAWTLVSNRKAALVSKVAALPEVYKVEVTDPTLARNDITPNNVTIPGQPVK